MKTQIEEAIQNVNALNTILGDMVAKRQSHEMVKAAITQILFTLNECKKKLPVKK